ncbi:molybdopterin-dependent oxidoreductase [Streptomyces sp. H10-C2]|uniref:molybdopterin-dependent oxidoreductase n=1 Tax=unclassified Streptomyces TaxID=2593676 RepID=UPI0024B9A614|nr:MULTISPECIES: molybdopterin-dependent oxidoreductase [unclassified Streptomyces]MDJ0343112.1 molybdopterin-dependent oxidoreductase [Streptomyces sp. PH10-H1]MDJ0371054.1 molybdopterin-dependent oxidoreductase [Streptomyces sp. H10-C2]
MTRTALRICPLCEATCGLTLTIEDDKVTSARGDRDDVFSAGFICPKGATFGALDADPDRLRRPLVRKDGRLVETGWAEAFAAAAAGLGTVTAAHGPDAVGVVLGNPNVHTVAGGLYPSQLIGALRSRNIFSASTLDQMPKHVSCGYLFGDPNAIPVPDLDRTDYLLILGANPLVSNGSLATAADFPGKLKALRRRGGRITVIDPKRTRTAEAADRHISLRPGTDAALLFALVQVLFAEGLTDLGTLADQVTGVEEVRALAAEFTPEAVEGVCEVPAGEIRALARELAAAPSAAVYGRLGSTAVEFGTLGSWLVDVLNVLTGNLDRPGGAMFPLAPTARAPRAAAPGKGFTVGRWYSRVSGHPEVKGELPAAAFAEEIDTPGEGRIRAVIALAANPVLSAPDGHRLDRALAGLDFMISVDPYLNETSRHAHVVLPPPRPAQSAHYDFAFSTLAVRNTVRYTRAAVPLEDGRPDEPEIYARLVHILSGAGAGADPAVVDEQAIARLLTRATADPQSPFHGDDPGAAAGRLSGRTGYERRLDLMLRMGPYALTLDDVLAHPHGIDLGPLAPRVPEILRTPSGRIELAPAPIAADVPRLLRSLTGRAAGPVLIGRRHLRSNNSWMHNVPALAGGTNLCTLQVHPDDAARFGLTDGSTALVKGDGGEIEAPVEVTDAVRPGVVSLPHGWGHDRDGTRLATAGLHPGANVNQLLDGTRLDPLSGTAVLNGFPVQISAASGGR